MSCITCGVETRNIAVDLPFTVGITQRKTLPLQVCARCYSKLRAVVGTDPGLMRIRTTLNMYGTLYSKEKVKIENDVIRTEESIVRKWVADHDFGLRDITKLVEVLKKELGGNIALGTVQNTVKYLKEKEAQVIIGKGVDPTLSYILEACGRSIPKAVETIKRGT